MRKQEKEKERKKKEKKKRKRKKLHGGSPKRSITKSTVPTSMDALMSFPDMTTPVGS